jgi:hypothetical protein
MMIDASQSPALFRLASERLQGTYRADWDHKILSVISPKGVLAQAVFTDIVVGLRAELSMWIEPEHGLAGRRFLRQVCKAACHHEVREPTGTSGAPEDGLRHRGASGAVVPRRGRTDVQTDAPARDAVAGDQMRHYIPLTHQRLHAGCTI